MLHIPVSSLTVNLYIVIFFLIFSSTILDTTIASISISSPSIASIILIDDDQLVTLSLKTILESTGSVQVLATGTSGAEAIALYQQWKPDVLLLDIQMPNGSGLDAGEQILQQDPNARILFLTTFSDDAYIAKALELGAKGYLLKQDFAGIVPALEAVMQGQHVFGEQVVSCFSKQFKKKSPL